MIYALHGFLGQPQDWMALFEGHALHPKIHATDLFNAEIPSLNAWAEHFNRKIEQGNSDRHVLMGYSMGGRLAAHALLQQPTLWDAAIIISAHPGLESLVEKQARQQLDEEWAVRFEHEPWNDLMRAWNARGVFQKDAFHFQRQENEYKREILAKALRHWSLAKQEHMVQQLAQLEMPILWMAGGDDAAYAMQAKNMRFKHPLSKVTILQGLGHRLPWQNPAVFLDEITNFLNNR